jgi:hypothetical protein
VRGASLAAPAQGALLERRNNHSGLGLSSPRDDKAAADRKALTGDDEAAHQINTQAPLSSIGLSGSKWSSLRQGVRL